MKRIAFVILLTACSKTEQPAADKAAPAPAAAPAAPAGKPYTLSIEAPKQAKVGEKGQFRIVLVPAAGYHVNTDEFPFEINLEAPKAQLEKTTFERKDAKVYTKEQARFEIAFTPKQAGPEDFTAKIYLAVCREQECIPRHETLSWTTTAN